MNAEVPEAPEEHGVRKHFNAQNSKTTKTRVHDKTEEARNDDIGMPCVQKNQEAM
jgi:hypothetical protein